MNILSLFTGIGGLDLGLERAGMQIVAQVEIDPYCRAVLRKHWPEVPQHDDVRTCVDWWQSRPRPPVDLVCGGFPCQPVSNAGLRLAQADDRWLWPAYANVVRLLRPRYVLVENVPGLLSAGMGDVLGDLAGLGYDTEWDRIPAAFVGAPHIRRRIFLVAYPNGQRQLQPCGSVSEVRGRPSHGRSQTDVADPGSGRHQPPEGVIFAGRHSPIDRRRWPTEPDVGRMVDGFPSRVDRIRALGNAVVPAVAEHVGHLILNHHRQGAA